MGLRLPYYNYENTIRLNLGGFVSHLCELQNANKSVRINLNCLVSIRTSPCTSQSCRLRKILQAQPRRSLQLLKYGFCILGDDRSPTSSRHTSLYLVASTGRRRRKVQTTSLFLYWISAIPIRWHWFD